MANKRLRKEMFKTARGLHDLGVMDAGMLRKFDAQAWDRQIAADLKTGKLDSLINEARAEFKAARPASFDKP